MGVDQLDPDACYRAAFARDARWDGRFYVCVATTGVYCRPTCPARKPSRHDCCFYPTAAAAVAAGFQACKRCRPEPLLSSGHWTALGELAARAVLMIRDAVVDEVGVAGLAARLEVSRQHLLRVFIEDIGVLPQQLARTRRVLAARMLIEWTTLPFADIACTAGFASVRQCNAVVRQEFGATPSQLRRARRDGSSAVEPGDGPQAENGVRLVLRLGHRLPYATLPLRRFLAGHVVPGLERHDPASGEHTRTFPAPHGPAVVTAALQAGRGSVTVRLRLANIADVAPAINRVRRWLDLGTDPLVVDRALAADPLLAPMIAVRAGLRVPGAVDGAETALLAVLGQQVSLGAARTFAGRLVAAFGAAAPDGLTAFPTGQVLAAAGPDALREATGVTRARARTLHAVATATSDGLALDPDADHTATRAALLALPGIGPWTTEYIALRALGDPDAFPAGDLVLQRALGVRSARLAEQRAHPWRPWRGYGLLHLWTHEVFT